MSKVKSRSKNERSRKSDEDTSDDDYIDPKMEKYFQDTKDKIHEKLGLNGKQQNKSKNTQDDDEDDDFEDISDFEEEEDDQEEMDLEEEQSEDQDEGEENSGDEKNEGEEEIDVDQRKKLTLKTINSWSTKLAEGKPIKIVTEVTKALKSALLNVIPNRKADSAYRVDGSEMFNAVIRLCIRDFFPCMLRILNLGSVKSDSDDNKLKLASSGENWKKLKGPVRSYLDDMLALASNLNEPEVLNAILRHIRLLINFYLCFPKTLKLLIKLLIQIWSQSDEKSRLIAFVCLHKIVANTHEKNQNFIFKNLYLSFARNSKFTSINTLPLINFMQRSLIEIYALNPKMTYEHVFVFIRQLGIHLRNAMNLKKKESYQAVYNWQFIHSLVLWSKLLSAQVKTSHGVDEHLHQLIYPLTQIIIGTIKLIPTPRYYPLRFHCVNALISLSNSTDVFIPIIPFILEVFDITDFNKKHASISVKQLNFSFLLKLNKQQLQDKAFKDVLIDIIYDHLILYLQHQSCDIAFPELVLPLMIRIKEFLKKCKNTSYCKVMKGLTDKVQENCKFIEERRSKATFTLKDKKQVDLWTEKTKEAGTPLTNWYSRYKTLREREILMEISNKDYISQNKVPVVERPSNEQKEEERKEFGELFVNLDDDSDTDSLDFVPKKKNNKEEDREEESEDQFSDAGQEKEDEDENLE
ncbi:nucleolar complex 2 -like protein [Brachionus plicatilis]|uniref:Nucleolar complex 2-like protein n=1 Tax=Brachionus plicatilis TaxID=10195 RepID=A0A3M7QGL2_BRAPC|nr:nucleolar complex 2 -like protein [Brachionus plicatilis]